jgi:hypothetical protein
MSGDLGSVSDMWASVSKRIKDDPPEIYSTENCSYSLRSYAWLKERASAPPRQGPIGPLFGGSVIRLSTFDETQAYFTNLLE